MHRKPLLVLALFALAPFTYAQDAPKPEKPPLIKASDKSALAAHMNKDVVVEGTVLDAVWSTTGKVMNIRFEDTDDSHFIAAVFQRNKSRFDTAFDGDACKALTGAKVQLSGKLGTFRDQPQVILDKPSQITLLAKPPQEKSPDQPRDATDPKK